MPRRHEGMGDDMGDFGGQLGGFSCFFPPIIGAPAGYDGSPRQSLRIGDSSDYEEEEEQPKQRGFVGFLNDFAELRGAFKTEIAKISGVLERKVKIGGDAWSNGATRKEVLDFVKDLRRESWVDFVQVPDPHFDMSRSQKEHVTTVECLSPNLAVLRRSLCPSYMSEGSFWKIYFVHLHPRLTKLESEFLSTCQIVDEISRLNSTSQHAAAESSSSVMSGKSVDIQEEVMHMEMNKQSMLISESQNFTPEDFSSKTMENSIVEQAAGQSHVRSTSNEVTRLQYIDMWFDTATASREMDAATETRQHVRNKGAEDGDDVTMARYESSLAESVDQDYSLISSNKRFLSSKKRGFGDCNNTVQRPPIKGLPDDGLSDWYAVDDTSDYEIV